MLESVIRFLVQLLIIVLVAWLVWVLGNEIIGMIGAPAVAFLIWKLIVALCALLAILRAARPWIPLP